MSDTPSVTEFDPHIIPYQYQVLETIRNFPYEKLGVLEILLSGSFGSAKSSVLCHAACTHVLFNPKSRLCLCRKAMPDLKDTIFSEIVQHLEGSYTEGVDFWVDHTKAKIKFSNGSEIISRSWHDKKYKKFRSLKLSSAIVEELTENDSKEFNAFYKELFARVNRLKHVRESFVLSATNPDSPSHSAYQYFIDNNDINRLVFYSVTSDNPFLPPNYVERIKEGLTSLEVERYIYGRWVEISSEVIYYSFDCEKSMGEYEINYDHDLIFSFDFNIAAGKPMSCLVAQWIDNCYYCLDELVIQSARTLDILEELEARNYLDMETTIIIHGDATGKAGHASSKKSNYDIIQEYLSNAQNKYGVIRFEIDVPSVNPPIRHRHSIVNGQLKNAKGETHIFIDHKCKNLEKGLRMVKLKDNAQYIEDDSLPYQHITTSLGYSLCKLVNYKRETFTKTRLY